jgi:hypothetical protein
MDTAPERIDGLFVQSAAWFSSDDDHVTLHGIVMSTIYVADRPRREVGHMPTSRFLEFWDEGRGAFAQNPPKAVLSFLDLDSSPGPDASLVLRAPRLEDDDLTYMTEVLGGTLPAEAGACSLFIDVSRRPLVPASGALRD